MTVAYTPQEAAILECRAILKAAMGPKGVEEAARDAWRAASVPALDYIARLADVRHRCIDTDSERFRTSWRLKRWAELTIEEKRALGAAAKRASVDPVLPYWRAEFECLTVLGWL